MAAKQSDVSQRGVALSAVDESVGNREGNILFQVRQLHVNYYRSFRCPVPGEKPYVRRSLDWALGTPGTIPRNVMQ